MWPGSVVRLHYKICIIKTITLKAVMIECLYKKEKKNICIVLHHAAWLGYNGRNYKSTASEAIIDVIIREYPCF